jgi:enoyl-CoA hydratase
MLNVTTAGPVRTLTLDRPEALNALTPALLEELADALAVAAADESLRVVVLTGAGRAFSAGVDLKALQAMPLEGGNVADVLNAPARRATELLSTMPQVTIAKVNGFCFTGALELALACDIMIVATEAKMGDTHAKWGLRPTWGMSRRLVEAVGITRARYLSHTAVTFLGADAAAWGMAALAVPLAELDARTEELAASIVDNNASAQRAYKDLYNNQQDRSFTEGLAFEFNTEYQLSGAGDRLKTFG